MTQEEKQLVFTDLCARLPYGVIVQYDDYFDKDYPRKPKILTFTFLEACSKEMDKWNPKPYLRPMSSMTEEEKNYVYNHFGWTYDEGYFNLQIEGWDYLYSIHIDVHELIPKELALEAPEGMYKTE